MRPLIESGAYLKAALIRGWRLFEGGAYSRAALNRGRRLFEDGASLIIIPDKLTFFVYFYLTVHFLSLNFPMD